MVLSNKTIQGAIDYNVKASQNLWIFEKLPFYLLDKDPDSYEFYDMVVKTQARLNLNPDGKLGPQTLAAISPHANRHSKLDVYGLDISKWQKEIDWKRVRRNHPEIEFVIIKAAQGTTLSEGLLQNVFQVRDLGFKLGYYVWPTPGTGGKWDVNDELTAVLKILSKVPKADLPLALDLEANDNKISIDQYTTWVEQFASMYSVETGNPVMIYTSEKKAKALLRPDHNLSNLDLWCPRYGTNTGKLEDSTEPKVPHGWTKYDIWQFTSKATVSGISTNVDKNITSKDWLNQYV